MASKRIMEPLKTSEEVFDSDAFPEFDGEHTPPGDGFARITGECTSETIVLAAFHRDGMTVCHIQPGVTKVIGRDPGSDLCLTDQALSRAHAEVSYRNGALMIRDLKSTNGTRVNGEEIGRDGSSRFRCLPYHLSVGDVVVAGNGVITVYPESAFGQSNVGIGTHDQFVALLRDEITRAKTFNRTVGIIFVRALGGSGLHASGWYAAVRKPLRRVDRISLFSPSIVEIFVAEPKETDLLRMTEAIVESASERGVAVGCSIALFPAHAKTADELIEAGRVGLQSVSTSNRIVSGRAEAHRLKVTEKTQGEPLVTVINPAMLKAYQFAHNVAKSTIPVLISGPPGTGKKLLAQLIHRDSARNNRKLRFVNCAALPVQRAAYILLGAGDMVAEEPGESIFEQLDGGTIVLESVDRLSQEAQEALVKLLDSERLYRVDSKRHVEVDVRIIATTSENLLGMCARGGFDSKLYRRLAPAMITVPPLRFRVDEILPLARIFIRDANRTHNGRVKEIDAEVQKVLLAHAWPGNVRELRNVIDRAVASTHGTSISIDCLPGYLAGRSARDLDNFHRRRRTERTRYASRPASDIQSPLSDSRIERRRRR